MESLRGVCSSKYNANFKLLLRIEFIPRVCFLLLAFRKVNTNSEEVNREIYVFFHSERKEDFIKSCLFIRLFYVLHHHFETKQLHMFFTIYRLLCFPTSRLSALALDHSGPLLSPGFIYNSNAKNTQFYRKYPTHLSAVACAVR